MNGMTCREFDEFVHGFVRMELLDVSVREAALEHAGACAACADRMADAVALADATVTAGGMVQDMQTPQRVEDAVLAAFRGHHRRAAWLQTFEWATLATAAAMLLMFVWTSGSRSKGPLQPSPRRNVSSQSAGSVDAKVSMPTVPSASGQIDSDDSTQGAEVEIADTSTSDAFVASDFVPVPFTAGIAADDPGMVVRVQLTRASLTELGYPIAQTPDNDLILADVLVDQDGWPRAVKLIQ
jgi:hypothetical protein